jgi:hypothetical protein
MEDEAEGKPRKESGVLRKMSEVIWGRGEGMEEMESAYSVFL